jgi:signal transduction histidine kinase
MRRRIHSTRSNTPPGNRLAKQLLIYIVLISSSITLLLTAFQLLLQYREQLAEIEDQIRQIETSYLKSLITSVWALDQEQIYTQLDGLRHLPYLEQVAIVVDGQPRWTSGQVVSASVLRKQLLLNYYYNDKNTPIGALQITLSLDRVYRRLIDNAVVILAGNAVKTFLVAGFLLLIVSRLIGRPLTALADFANDLDLQRLSDKHLTLDRRFGRRHKPDELDALALAFNQMRERLLAGLQERERTAVAQQRLEQELHRQKDRLVQLERITILGELTTGITHEINQPLTVISGYTDICRRALQSNQPDIGQVAGVLEKIYGETHRASAVIRSLRNLSGSQPGERKTVVVRELLADSLLLNATETYARGIALTIGSMPDASVQIEADPVQLQLVLRNLIHNAIDAGAEHGIAGTGADASVRISAEPGDPGFICISVIDHGPGVAAAVSDRIFDPLFTTKTTGMGIGLALCRTIAEAHGGWLGFYNNPGGGATFYLLLPVADV